MLFSFIVPIYNVENYIEKCIDSLINQTFRDIEIILVDDESPDNCPKICERYAKVDNRIKVIHKKNGGLSDARNAGLKIATGDYVIFVDSDDYIDINTCKNFAFYAKKNYDILIGEAVVENAKLNLSHIKSDNIMTGEEYLLNAYRAGKAPMAVWLNVYRRKFLLNNNLKFKYGILHEDEEFTPRTFLNAKRVFCTNIIFYHYIIRDNSITTKEDKRKNANDLYKTCCELEIIYGNIQKKELRNYLLDSLAVKYLNMFQVGKLYQYGEEYLHKDFIKKNAKMKRTRYKTYIYSFSPWIYYHLNNKSIIKSIFNFLTRRAK